MGQPDYSEYDKQFTEWTKEVLKALEHRIANERPSIRRRADTIAHLLCKQCPFLYDLFDENLSATDAAADILETAQSSGHL